MDIESSGEEWKLKMDTSESDSDESEWTVVTKKRNNSPKKAVGVGPKRIRKMHTCQRCGQRCQNVARHMQSARCKSKCKNIFLHTTMFILFRSISPHINTPLIRTSQGRKFPVLSRQVAF